MVSRTELCDAYKPLMKPKEVIVPQKYRLELNIAIHKEKFTRSFIRMSAAETGGTS